MRARRPSARATVTGQPVWLLAGGLSGLWPSRWTSSHRPSPSQADSPGTSPGDDPGGTRGHWPAGVGSCGLGGPKVASVLGHDGQPALGQSRHIRAGTSVEDPIAAKPNRARRVIALVARPVGQVLRRAESLGSTPAQSGKIILLSWSAAGTRGDAATTLPTRRHTVGAGRARIRHAGHARNGNHRGGMGRVRTRA